MPSFPFLHRPQNPLEQGGRTSIQARRNEADSELAEQCPNCHRQTELSKLWNDANTCSCGYHFRIKAAQRIRLITDPDSFVSEFDDLASTDPLDFPGYQKKLEATRSLSEGKEAVLCGRASIGGAPCCLFVMDPYFMMGTMGTVVGEKITRTFELATQLNLPVVGYTVSGGARMQEGMLSLMQMAKTSAALKRHSNAGLFYLTILTDPTLGGVMASFAMDGDIILAEPGATAGFAGARVIEQTVRKKLPSGFQTSEFLLEHGFVDAIVPRLEQRAVISKLLFIHQGGTAHE
jgi:acetyl-CoA carboxylase carboxyl transferase subunit beta